MEGSLFSVIDFFMHHLVLILQSDYKNILFKFLSSFAERFTPCRAEEGAKIQPACDQNSFQWATLCNLLQAGQNLAFRGFCKVNNRVNNRLMLTVAYLLTSKTVTKLHTQRLWPPGHISKFVVKYHLIVTVENLLGCRHLESSLDKI